MKIIGIKLEYGDSSVIKNLKPGWFPFGDYQEPMKDNHWQYLKDGQQDDSKYLSQMYKSIAPEGFPETMQLSVQCIVGKNGSGKSTLLELFYRIINDFACKCIKEKWTEWVSLPKDINLEEAKGYAAKLFFETDGKLQYLYRNKSITQYAEIENGTSNILFGSKSPRYGTERLSQMLHSFFYTIANNYSLYSFNSNDYAKKKIWDKNNTNYLERNDGRWLECIFHKNDGYLTPLVIAPFRDNNGNIDRANEDSLAKQRLSTLAILFESQGLSFLENYHPEQLKYRFNPNAKDFYRNKIKEIVVSDKSVDSFLNCFAFYPKVSQEDKKNYITPQLKFILQKKEKEIYRLMKDEWSYYLNKIHEGGGESERHEKIVNDTIYNYLIYKTLKISTTYPSYGEILFPQNPIATRNLRSREMYELDESFLQIFNHMKTQSVKDLIHYIASPDNTNHITLKIQQCLAFISRYYYKTGSYILFTQCPINNNSEDSFLSANYATDGKQQGEARKRNGYTTYEEVFLRMPPAFFEWELFFGNENSKMGMETNGDEGLMTLTQMSSGERHDLVSTSYLMYHLTNLQSVQSDRFRIPYHHVNLIFDEVELYFHPEYQRKYLANLLKTISQCHISDEKIRSINIIIVTHSPFILSDVPLSHTLYLEKGEAKSRSDETFSANIHNLLVNQFFIEQPMGEVAVNVINKIVEAKNIERKEDYDYYMYIASKIGDTYIRNRLKHIIENRVTDKIRLTEEYERLTKRMEEIKCQLSKENDAR